MTTFIESIRGEFMRYKKLAEGAISQMEDQDLSTAAASVDNSIAVICWHISGNLRSRFTDFLTTDGEKPWRNREGEFEQRHVSREELLRKWEDGWSVLMRTLSDLSEQQLGSIVTIRGESLRVHEALHRALAHVAYHVGQIVYIAKTLRGKDWTYLSIPPGQSDKAGQRPTPDFQLPK